MFTAFCFFFFSEIGAKWRNFWTPAILEDNLVFGYLVGMLLLDAFLYGLVAWYLETVFPGQNGLPQPWYFFFMVSFSATVIAKGFSP